MKVCFLTANYPPEAIGGTEQVVTALARELRALGVEVIVISGSDAPFEQDVMTGEHDGVVVHRIARRPEEHGHSATVRPRLPALVRELLQQARPDVVHVHSLASLGPGMTPIARQLGARVAATFHDLWVTCARYFRVPAANLKCPTGVDRTPCVPCVNELVGTDAAIVEAGLAERDRLLRAEMALVQVASAPSATAARFVAECLPFARPIEVIPHGLLRPVPASHLAARAAAGAPLRVGTFGGLVRVKGVRELVEAVAGLPCELYLSGPFHEPGFEDEIRALAVASGTRLVLRGRYDGTGRHPARDLHLAVFPSKCQETYGLVVDEALAHGVPAVVSDQGALRERAGRGGVAVTEIARLAPLLRELVTSPARLDALRAAIPVSLPTIAVSARRHFELYRRLR
jgi:glycosyltransferase involved in cell wall biosynthesis